MFKESTYKSLLKFALIVMTPLTWSNATDSTLMLGLLMEKISRSSSALVKMYNGGNTENFKMNSLSVVGL